MADALPAPSTPTTPVFPPDQTISSLTASLENIQRRVGSTSSWPPPLPNEASSSTHSCGSGSDIRWEDEKRELEGQLMYCARIGQELLERHESFVAGAEDKEQTFKAAADQAERELIDVNNRLASAQHSNETLLTKLAESTRENSQLERRLLQSLTSLTLSDSSIATLRAELSSVRGALSRQAGAQARSTGWEEKLKTAETEKTELREELAAAKKKRLESERKATRAEETIAGLENKLRSAKNALQQANRLREEAAKEVATDAKARLEMMQAELVLPGAPNPDVQHVLDALMAENVLLKQDNTEIRDALAESRLAASGPISSNPETYYSDDPDRARGGNTISRSSTAFFSDELGASTSSRPYGGLDRAAPEDHRQHGRKDSWALSIGSAGGMRRHGHGRNDSWAPSIASTSSYTPSVGIRSPIVDDDEATFRKTGIYPLGAPRRNSRGSSNVAGSAGPPAPWTRGHLKRSFSVDRPRGVQRAFSGVDSIAERRSGDDGENDDGGETFAYGDDSPMHSPWTDGGASPFDEARRVSASQLENGSSLPKHITMEDLEVTSGAKPSPEKKKQVRRRPMMLLSRSTATQTDFADAGIFFSISSSSAEAGASTARPSLPFSPTTSSTNSDRQPPSYYSDVTPSSPKQQSESSSVQDPRTASLHILIDHMARLLTRISQSDVMTLTKRLKRQHLPGDVGHLSKSTITSILSEVAEFRMHFRAVMDSERKEERVNPSFSDQEKLQSLVTRKDFLALVKLFKDVFTELSTLRGTINEVILDPSSAVKLREAALYDEEEDERGRVRAKPVRQTSALNGWINPISKFFVTPPIDESDGDASSGRTSPRKGAESGKLHPSRAAPKLAAAATATAATVNVEFASSGAMRRAVSTIAPPLASTGLPPSPNSTLTSFPNAAASSSQVSSSSNSLAPPSADDPTGSLRHPPSQMRLSSRCNLRGIFAGATPDGRISPSGNWVMAGPGGAGAPPGRQGVGPKLRSASSQVFRSSSGTAVDPHSMSRDGPGGRSAASRSSRPLSIIVDAMLDPALNPSLTERPLRPTRSDESIRSTFLGDSSSPNPSGRLTSHLSGTNAAISSGQSAAGFIAGGGSSTRRRGAPVAGGSRLFSGFASRLFSTDPSPAASGQGASPSPGSPAMEASIAPSASPPRPMPPHRSSLAIGTSGQLASSASSLGSGSRTGGIGGSSLFSGLAQFASSVLEPAPITSKAAGDDDDDDEDVEREAVGGSPRSRGIERYGQIL